MALKFDCQHCGRQIVTQFLKVGEQAQCRACGGHASVLDTAVEASEEEASRYRTVPKVTASSAHSGASAQEKPASRSMPQGYRLGEKETAMINMRSESSKPVLICAVGLLAAFFMPWVQLFGVGISGYNLGQLGSYGNYAWVIPILAGATILVGYFGVNNRAVGAIAGIVPLSAIFYALVRIAGEGGGNATKEVLDVAGHVLSIGAWLTIIFSVAIIIAALVRTYPTTALSKQPEG